MKGLLQTGVLAIASLLCSTSGMAKTLIPNSGTTLNSTTSPAQAAVVVTIGGTLVYPMDGSVSAGQPISVGAVSPLGSFPHPITLTKGCMGSTMTPSFVVGTSGSQAYTLSYQQTLTAKKIYSNVASIANASATLSNGQVTITGSGIACPSTAAANYTTGQGLGLSMPAQPSSGQVNPATYIYIQF